MDKVTEARCALTDYEQMRDAMAGCVPCKLCGGKAVISDAGTGAGYFITCSNSTNFHASKGCLIDQRRLGGWAYNVMDWWNRLMSATPAPDSEKLREALTPSGATKAAYLGEFKFDVMFPSLDEDDDEPVPHPVTVPWDTIKEIMAAIASRAALGASL